MLTTKLITPKQRQALDRMYHDLRFDARRQEAFNKRTCGQPQPRTVLEAIKVHEGLEAFTQRLLKPYQRNLKLLLTALYTERSTMTPWERDQFLPDVSRKLAQDEHLTPHIVKKLRQIAHKYDVPCGFPPLRDLAASQMTEAAQG